MSRSVPFLVRPEKLDGTAPGDMGFDPMRLSDGINLQHAKWSEIKHGRICMLAIVGILVQQSGIHFPGELYTNTDIFGAPATVGWAVNVQIFLFMSCVEAYSFNMTYGDGTPGDIGWDFPGLMSKLSDADKKKRMESEIVHGRLAMIAFVGAIVQTLLYGPVVG